MYIYFFILCKNTIKCQKDKSSTTYLHVTRRITLYSIVKTRQSFWPLPPAAWELSLTSLLIPHQQASPWTEWRYDTDSDVDDDVTITLHNTSSESDSQPTLEKELEHSSPRDFKRDAAIQPFSNYPHNIEQGWDRRVTALTNQPTKGNIFGKFQCKHYHRCDQLNFSQESK